MGVTAGDGHRPEDEMLPRSRAVAVTDVGSADLRSGRRFAGRVAHAVPWILGARSSWQRRALCPVSRRRLLGATLSDRQT